MNYKCNVCTYNLVLFLLLSLFGNGRFFIFFCFVLSCKTLLPSFQFCNDDDDDVLEGRLK